MPQHSGTPKENELPGTVITAGSAESFIDKVMLYTTQTVDHISVPILINCFQ